MSEHPTPKDDSLETVDEVCDALRIGRTRFYDLLKSEQLTAVKLGSSTRVRRSERLRFQASLPAVTVNVAA